MDGHHESGQLAREPHEWFSSQQTAAGVIFIISLPSSLLLPDLQSRTLKLLWYSITKASSISGALCDLL